MPRISKKKLIIIALLVWVAIVVWVGVVHQYQIMHKVPQKAPQVQQAPLHQDQEVVGIMKEMYLDTSGLNLYYAPNPDLPDALAVFEAPNSIYVRPDAPIELRAPIIMHEYIHYVQTTKDPAGATSFYPYVLQLVQSNTFLNKRMANYQLCDTCKLEREAEAVACTEMPDSALRDDFENWCFKYLPRKYILFP